MSEAVAGNDGAKALFPDAGGPRGGSHAAQQDVVMQDALQYLERVQQEFADRPDVYLTFLSIMKEFKAGKMETPGVVQQVSQLFQGHEGLLRGFQNFLSGSSAVIEPALDMRKDASQSAADIKMQDAMAYMDKVKEKFADQQEVYVEFLDIIKGFQEQRIDTPGVIAGVSRLFVGDDELLQGFNAFLPEGHRMPPPRGNGGADLGGPLPPAPSSAASSSASQQLPAVPTATSASASTALAQQRAAMMQQQLEASMSMKDLQMTDAMKYMDRVRDTFQDKPEIYGEFLEIMKCFQSLKIDMSGVINKVCVLFKGHEELLQGFKCFLPEGHRMPSSHSMNASTDSLSLSMASLPGGSSAAPSSTKPTLQIGDAMKYMDRVRDVFIDQPEIYMQFLDIMKEFQADRIDTPGVIQQVSMLFQGHDDLLYGFNAFLPEDHRMPSHPLPGGVSLPHVRSGVVPHPGLLGGPPSGLMGIGGAGAASASMVMGGSIPSASSAMIGMMGGPQAMMGSMGAAAAMAAGGGGVGGGGGPGGGAGGGPGGGDVNYAVNFVAKVKQRFSRDPDKYKLFLEVLHQYEENQPGTEYLTGTVAKLFADSPDLLKEFMFFLPPQVQVALQQQGHLGDRPAAAAGAGAPGEPDMSLAVNFLNKVKQRFVNERDKYQLFLELLHEYERGNIPPEEVLAAVNKLLVHHPDLCREFTYFLPETRARRATGGDGGAVDALGAMAGGARGLGGGAMDMLAGHGAGGGMSLSGLAAGAGGLMAAGGLAGLEGSLAGLGGSHMDVNFAMHFVNKVKSRFANDPDKYTLFLNALLEYEKNPNWPNTIIDVANQLFGNHPDLLGDFSFFLPRQQQQGEGGPASGGGANGGGGGGGSGSEGGVRGGAGSDAGRASDSEARGDDSQADDQNGDDRMEDDEEEGGEEFSQSSSYQKRAQQEEEEEGERGDREAEVKDDKKSSSGETKEGDGDDGDDEEVGKATEGKQVAATSSSSSSGTPAPREGDRPSSAPAAPSGTTTPAASRPTSAVEGNDAVGGRKLAPVHEGEDAEPAASRPSLEPDDDPRPSEEEPALAKQAKTDEEEKEEEEEGQMQVNKEGEGGGEEEVEEGEIEAEEEEDDYEGKEGDAPGGGDNDVIDDGVEMGKKRVGGDDKEREDVGSKHPRPESPEEPQVKRLKEDISGNGTMGVTESGE